MRPYAAFFRVRFRTLIQYRAAAIAGLIPNFVFGFVRVMTMKAFYMTSPDAMAATDQQMITYIWLGQVMLGLLPWSAEPDIGQVVRTGQIAYELNRPLDLYWMWYARCVAQRVAPTMLRAVPMFIICSLLPAPYTLIWPEPARLMGFALLVLGTVLLASAITSFINVTLLWTVAGSGVERAMNAVSTVFSGMIVPLAVFPDALQTVLKYQPFSGVFDFPGRYFAGLMPISEAPTMFLLQITWAVAIIILCRLLLKRGLRRVTIAGG